MVKEFLLHTQERKMAKKKIVVIGAGFAGISATKMLSSKLKDDAEITLIDKHSYQTMMTQLHEVAAGRVPFTYAQYDLNVLLGKRKNVSILTDKVVSLNKENKTVTTQQNGTINFDYIIVAMGGEPNDFGVPGVKEFGFTLWSLEDAMSIKRQLETMVQLASTELDDKKRKALLTFNVAGSGFTGIEMIGELVDWRKKVAKDWKLDINEITLNVVEMMPTILNTLDRKQADKAHAYLEKKGVNVLTGHGITAVAEDHIVVNTAARGEEPKLSEIPSHTLIWTTGVQGNTEAKAFDMTESERGNRLMANEFMEAQGFEGQGIYVAGDVSAFMEETGRPQPQIVQAAEQTAHTAASNIISDIKGGEKHKFVGKYQGTMVSVGSQWGVAMIGNTRLTGFWAMLMKNFVYIIYTLQLRSMYHLFGYMRDEFFNVEDKRNFMRGHISRRSNVLWAVPLRLFYGFMWVCDSGPKLFGAMWPGGTKADSWMTDSVHLSTFMKSGGGWIPDPITAGASGHVATASEITKALDTAGLSKVWFSLNYEYATVPQPILKTVPQWMQPMMKIFIPNVEMALFMQKAMTIVEFLLGLAIMAGLFTFIASGITAVLTLMFASTGMLTWTGIWYVFAAVAIMAGAGRAFGLDLWVQPWLQKFLGQLWYGKQRSIYRGR